MSAVRAYHFDRSGLLRPGMELVPMRYDDVEPPSFAAHADALFPDGVSRHGEQYLLRGSSSALLVAPNIELIFEYVRRASFPTMPSRFTSVFGWETPAAAAVGRSAIPGGIGPGTAVWLIECAIAQRVDMRLLAIEGSILATSALAHRYWEGGTLGEEDNAPDHVPAWELLMAPPVRVIERVA